MTFKHIRILALYLGIILAMGFAYFVVQEHYSYERTHGTSPAETPVNTDQ